MGGLRRIDARQFCPDGPEFFPRLLQKAIWMFCAEAHLGICHGNRIDDRAAARKRSAHSLYRANAKRLEGNWRFHQDNR